MAIQSLAGDHCACVTGSSPLVTILGYPPSACATHTCGDPLMLEMKLTHFPSGEKLGPTALPTRAMRATAAATSLFLPEGGVCPTRIAGMQKARAAAAIFLLNILISLLRHGSGFRYAFICGERVSILAIFGTFGDSGNPNNLPSSYYTLPPLPPPYSSQIIPIWRRFVPNRRWDRWLQSRTCRLNAFLLFD